MIVAFSSAVNGALVAVIGGLVVTAMIGGAKFMLQVRDEMVAEVRHRVGTPNGHGNAIHMLETLLRGQTDQDERLARLESTSNDLAANVRVLDAHRAAVDDSMETHGERVRELESRVAVLEAAPRLAPVDTVE